MKGRRQSKCSWAVALSILLTTTHMACAHAEPGQQIIVNCTNGNTAKGGDADADADADVEPRVDVVVNSPATKTGDKTTAPSGDHPPNPNRDNASQKRVR